MFSKQKPYTIGLVLSGGAARGFAHLGVLQAMKEMDIRPSIISAVSAGSIVGALYADGYEPREVLELFHSKSFFKYAEFVFRKTGLMRADGLKDMLSKHLRTKNIEDLPMPFLVTVTNLRNGKCEYITKGPLVEAIMASSSIPVLFIPGKFKNQFYIDGGISDNFPVQPIKNQCKKIIGVHVNPVGVEERLNSLMKIAARAFHLSVASGLDVKKKHVNLFIEPQELRDYNLLDVAKGQELFDIGYQEAKDILSKKKQNYQA